MQEAVGWRKVDYKVLLGAGLSLVSAVVSGLIVNYFSNELVSPGASLEYYSERAVPFELGGEQIAIYHSTVRNTGGRSIENVFMVQSVSGAKIEGGRVTTPPGVEHRDVLVGNEFSSTILNLNPDESASVSTFVKSRSDLPERPKLKVRAQGATAREAVAGGQGVGVGRVTAIAGFTSVATLVFSFIFVYRKEVARTVVPVLTAANSAGVELVTLDFNKGVDWPLLLQKTKRLDVFVVFGRTWREGNLPHLQQLADKKVSVRLVVPDYSNDDVLLGLSRRFGMKPEDVARDIQETVFRFRQIFGGKKSRLGVWLHVRVPTYTYYRVDGACVVTSYRHRVGKGEVPVFQLRPGGSLANFYDAEFDDFVAQEAQAVRALNG